MSANNAPIITPSDLSAISGNSGLREFLRSNFAKKTLDRPFEDIMKTLQSTSNTTTSKPTASATTSSAKQTTSTATPTVAVETPSPAMGFDEAFSRLRMMLGALPESQRQKMLPFLIERISKRVKPEDVEDFKTLAYSLGEDNSNSNAFEKYLPILLILSMMRGG
jgi:hypothetical protein